MRNQFITIQKLLVKDYDLMSINVMNITLFNNIETIGSTLEIVFNDVTDIKTKLPIKGGEDIEVIFNDEKNSAKYKKTFVLTKFQELDAVNSANVITKIIAISKEAYTMSIKRDFNSYQNSISNIIKGYGTFKDENPTSDSNQVVIPGFSYSKAIQYMISDFTASHVCFETNDGFTFSDVKNLLIESDDTYVINDSNPMYKFNIIDWEEIEIFDALKEGGDNIYNNTYLTYNPNTKSIDSVSKSITSEESSLGKGTNYSTEVKDLINTKYNVLPWTNYMLSNSNKTFQMFNKKYELFLNGNMGLEVGSTLNIKNQDRLNPSSQNNIANGLFLVTKVAHHINNKEFYTKIEVVKNNYYKDL